MGMAQKASGQNSEREISSRVIRIFHSTFSSPSLAISFSVPNASLDFVLRLCGLLLSLCLFLGPAGAQEALQVGGSVLEQAYGTYDGSSSPAASDFGYGSSTTLDLNLDAKGERARASASLEAAVLDGEATVNALTTPSDELVVGSATSGEPVIAGRVRTLYVKLDEDWISVLAGRQVINYERGALWSPTDLYTKWDMTGLSPERLGVDALRLVVPIGATGRLDIAGAPTTEPAHGLYSARLSGMLLGVDSSLMAAREGAAGRADFGADFKLDLEAGIYGNVVYSLPDSSSAGSFRAAAGADWSFGDFIVAAEYYYNGGGAAADPLFPDARNLYADLSWKASQLFSLSGSTIWNMSGEAGKVTMLASWSAAQNAMAGGYCVEAWSRNGWATQLGATLEILF